MIGQSMLLNSIDKLICDNNFPRFSIVEGEKGQGKTELIKEISKRIMIPYCDVGIKIDDIREMIDMAYKLTQPIIYVISNADKMSIGAKNSLLKIIEEPPQQAYFIMELEQMENTLETIKSRATVFRMEPYISTEIEEMINKVAPGVDRNLESFKTLKHICSNYYEIETMIKYDVDEFYGYCRKVYDNVFKVESANSFKISEKLDTKDTGEGYDIRLFLKLYAYFCLEDVFYYDCNDPENDVISILTGCIERTVDCINKLKITGINKQSLLDIWVLDIRKLWLNETR